MRTLSMARPLTLVSWPDTVRRDFPCSAFPSVWTKGNGTDSNSSITGCQAHSFGAMGLREPEGLNLPPEPGLRPTAQAVKGVALCGGFREAFVERAASLAWRQQRDTLRRS